MNIHCSDNSSFLHADSEDWSDWANAHANLCLRWAHMPFCWFCRAAAQMKKTSKTNRIRRIMPIRINHNRITVMELSVINEPPRDKTNNVAVRPAKTQIWVFAGRTLILLVLSCRGSFYLEKPGVQLSSWPSARAVLPYAILVVCVPFPFGVWDRVWNTIVSVPDLSFSIYILFSIKQASKFIVILCIITHALIVYDGNWLQITWCFPERFVLELDSLTYWVSFLQVRKK